MEIDVPFNSHQRIVNIVGLICKVLNTNAPLKVFQELTSKLQYTSVSIPGGVGILSLLQMAIRGLSDIIVFDAFLRSMLEDWCTIVKCLACNPTSVLELVPVYLDYI